MTIVKNLYAEQIAQLQQDLATVTRERNEARKYNREQHPCVICGWPRPHENEHNICECCGFQEGYDNPAIYHWPGAWWDMDSDTMPTLVKQLQAQVETLTSAVRELIATALARTDDEWTVSPHVMGLCQRALAASHPPTPPTAD